MRSEYESEKMNRRHNESESCNSHLAQGHIAWGFFTSLLTPFAAFALRRTGAFRLSFYFRSVPIPPVCSAHHVAYFADHAVHALLTPSREPCSCVHVLYLHMLLRHALRCLLCNLLPQASPLVVYALRATLHARFFVVYKVFFFLVVNPCVLIG